MTWLKMFLISALFVARCDSKISSRSTGNNNYDINIDTAARVW